MARCAGCRLLQHAARDVPKLEHARLGVLFLGDRTEQLRELASREPSRQIHLKETILSVDESGAVSEIVAILCRDRRNAERIALDGNGVS